MTVWIPKKPLVNMLRACLVLSVLQSSHGITQKTASRSQFLTAGAASFFASTTFLAGAEECNAMTEKGNRNNPRYIQKELEMKYADGPDGNPRSRGVLVRRVSLSTILSFSFVDCRHPKSLTFYVLSKKSSLEIQHLSRFLSLRSVSSKTGPKPLPFALKIFYEAIL